MSCTLKEHYQKIHSLSYNNDELNQVCIKTTPTLHQMNRPALAPPSSPPHDVHHAEMLVTLPGLQVQQIEHIATSENSISNG